MNTNGLAKLLALHQRSSMGMTSGSPDTCTCGERVLPEPTTAWDDYRDIRERRDVAFAEHQVRVVGDALLAAAEGGDR